MKNLLSSVVLLCICIFPDLSFAVEFKQPPQGKILFIGCLNPTTPVDSTYEATFNNDSILIEALHEADYNPYLTHLNVETNETFRIKGWGSQKKNLSVLKWDKSGNHELKESHELPQYAGGDYSYNKQQGLISYKVQKGNPHLPTWKIEILNYNKNTTMQVHSNQVNDIYPSMSPNGKYLAFYSAISANPLSDPIEEYYDYEFWVVNAKTGEKVISLPVGNYNGHILYNSRWNDKSDKIVYESMNGNIRGLAILDLKTKKVTNINAEGIGAVCSPDDKFIAYSNIIREGQYRYNEIWIYDIEKSQNIQITNARTSSYSYADFNPVWSPDRRYIAFHRNGRPSKEWTNNQLWIVEIDTFRTKCVNSNISLSSDIYRWIPE